MLPFLESLLHARAPVRREIADFDDKNFKKKPSHFFKKDATETRFEGIQKSYVIVEFLCECSARTPTVRPFPSPRSAGPHRHRFSAPPLTLRRRTHPQTDRPTKEKETGQDAVKGRKIPYFFSGSFFFSFSVRRPCPPLSPPPPLKPPNTLACSLLGE